MVEIGALGISMLVLAGVAIGLCLAIIFDF